MRVDEVFKQAASQGTAPVSFEMFPPKGELTLDTAREVAGNLCKLSPSFVSVTPARPAARATVPPPPPSRI